VMVHFDPGYVVLTRILRRLLGIPGAVMWREFD